MERLSGSSAAAYAHQPPADNREPQDLPLGPPPSYAQSVPGGWHAALDPAIARLKAHSTPEAAAVLDQVLATVDSVEALTLHCPDREDIGQARAALESLIEAASGKIAKCAAHPAPAGARWGGMMEVDDPYRPGFPHLLQAPGSINGRELMRTGYAAFETEQKIGAIKNNYHNCQVRTVEVYSELRATARMALAHVVAMPCVEVMDEKDAELLA